MTTAPPRTDVVPRMGHDDWMAAAEEEYRRLGGLLAGLTEEEWRRPTDCAGWTVHDVVAHLVGAAESNARVPEFLRQARRGRHLLPGALMVDQVNAVQVDERRGTPSPALVTALADAGVRSVRARRRLPGLLRAVRVPFGPPLGTRSVGYAMDRIYTRDAWMHRIDLARATGRPLQLTADHDGRLVADVVAEWAGAHGRPFTLRLTGPAGGSWSRGTGGERLELDAVELCRIVSGRAPGEGLLATPVPF